VALALFDLIDLNTAYYCLSTSNRSYKWSLECMTCELIVSLLKKMNKEIDIKTFYLLLFFNFIYSIEENYEEIS
jgi:hypothetical protein